MKKFVLIKFASLAVAGLLSQGAFAQDGRINFTGDIVDAPCSVAPASQNLNVPLGRVSRTAFTGAGTKSTPALFKIELLNCGASAKGAAVTFSGTNDLVDPTNLRVANAGQVGGPGGTGVAATGVAIEIGDSAGTKIPLGSPSADYILGLGDNALNFRAAYVATTAAVTTGPANSTAQFTIAYK
ncbi:major type 1 subunit fimbrin (pilin) [Variovorax boronicumulans]|uniref:fimbrial protein n=1 Tax=Variovorax boronicumulans TaxID=436515 RepID=UPI0027865D2D|nr:fimbrial protein [Variovorax boronicumulans]MDP9994622.1 major type 1 subunit fimbrin (pilin) [Variovorax boronicumulans]MDQ0006036.1 major type 1 subunit fimbrin (pilin) [Variovorax boronicumulans]